MSMSTRRELLARVHDVLESIGEPFYADLVGAALSGPDDGLDAFLTSNTLWGGAGSVADQPGHQPGADRCDRRTLEAALIALGGQQIADGIVNPRTVGWVEAFKHWQRTGV